ncbi:hypothetical protein L209DRAFT_753517 [Thermothelomyces heterothallicus CBS 203.75]
MNPRTGCFPASLGRQSNGTLQPACHRASFARDQWPATQLIAERSNDFAGIPQNPSKAGQGRGGLPNAPSFPTTDVTKHHCGGAECGSCGPAPKGR